MSGESSDSTEFVSGCEGRPSRCRACSATSYRLTADGPRCNGCRRWVEKDDAAELPSDLGREQEPPEPRREGPTIAMVDELMENLPSPKEAFDRAFLDGGPTDLRLEDMLGLRDRLLGKKAEPSAPRVDEWDKQAALLEVELILSEGRE